MPIKEIDQGK